VGKSSAKKSNENPDRTFFKMVAGAWLMFGTAGALILLFVHVRG
jgi:hypothetical protein